MISGLGVGKVCSDIWVTNVAGSELALFSLCSFNVLFLKGFSLAWLRFFYFMQMLWEQE